MQMISEGRKGLSFLVRLNADRLIMLGTLVIALYAGAFLAMI